MRNFESVSLQDLSQKCLERDLIDSCEIEDGTVRITKHDIVHFSLSHDQARAFLVRLLKRGNNEAQGENQ